MTTSPQSHKHRPSRHRRSYEKSRTAARPGRPPRQQRSCPPAACQRKTGMAARCSPRAALYHDSQGHHPKWWLSNSTVFPTLPLQAGGAGRRRDAAMAELLNSTPPHRRTLPPLDRARCSVLRRSSNSRFTSAPRGFTAEGQRSRDCAGVAAIPMMTGPTSSNPVQRPTGSSCPGPVSTPSPNRATYLSRMRTLSGVVMAPPCWFTA